LGSVRGDVGADTLTLSGIGERWLRVRVTEASTTPTVDLSARVQLQVPAGVDYNLFVHCSCATGALTDADRTVEIGRDDATGDQSYDIYIEVRFASGTSRANWTLTVVGNVVTSNRACN
jgi:hypothetical protein